MTLSKPKGRVGCTFCFSTLDKTDPNPDLQDFVQCSNCGAFFHANCYHSQGKCSHCSADKIVPITLPSVPQLSARSLRPIETRGTHLVVTEKGVLIEHNRIKGFFDSIHIIATVLRSFLISVLFIAPITYIAAYTPIIIEKTIQTSSPTPEAILNIILHSVAPKPNQFIVALCITLMSAYLFFPKKLYNYQGVNSPSRRFIRLLACIVGIGLILLLSYDIHGNDILYNGLQSKLNKLAEHKNFDYAIVAFSAFILVFLMGFVRRRLDADPIAVSQFPSLFYAFVTFLGKVRYYIVWLLLIIVATRMADNDILRVWRSEWESLLNLDYIIIVVTNWTVIAFATSLGVAILLYWPSNHSPVQSHFGLLRTLGLVTCLIGLGWMYGLSISTQTFFETFTFAVSYTVLLLPVQRALC